MNRTEDPWGQYWSLAGKAGIGCDSEALEAYTSPEIHAAECEKIFRRVWLLIARESEIPQPGDFIKREIYPTKTEVILVRGKDGKIRGFHNTCAHRGASLVRAESGRANLFICPYHAWSYDTEGQCRAITGPEFFPQLEYSEVRLSSVHAELWNSFVFVNLDPTPRESLQEFLGEMGELYGDFPFHNFTHCLEMVQDINTNWKCFFDAFVEGYHANFVHKKTGPMFLTAENPLNVFYDGRLLDRHSSFLVQSNPDWQPKGEVAKFVYSTAGASVVGDPGNPDAVAKHQAFMNHRGINPLGLPQFGVRIVNLFPITQLDLMTNRYQVQQYWPLDHQRTRHIVRIYTMSPPTSYSEQFAENNLKAFARDLFTEDVRMTELQYQGMRGGGIKKVYFGENEVGIRHLHQVIHDHLED